MEWPAMTGNITITREDLVDCAAAAMDDPGVPNPRLKLTQKEDTHGQAITEPSFGTVTNLRFDESEQTLYGDIEGVPAWLAEILPFAYPSRSVEIYWGVTTTTGGQWKAVLGAVQLLGVEWPGCTTLADLPLYYGDKKPETVELVFDQVPATTAAALKGGDQVGKDTKLSVAVEDVRRSYYDVLDDQGNYSWWIKQVLLDPNQLVVENEWEGDLFLVDFSIDGDEITFEEPEKVKVEYVPIPQAEETTVKKAAASMFCSGIQASGRTVLAHYANPEEAGRVVKMKGGNAMNDEQRKELATKLGLPEDATEEQVNAKLQENALAQAGEETTPPADDTETPPEDDSEPETTPPASAGLTVSVDKAQWEQNQRDAQLGREARLTQIRNDATTIVTDAVKDGRIAPASKEAWFKSIFDEKNGRLVETEVAALKALAAGRIPLEERGVNGGNGDDPSAFTGEAYPTGWFPEVQRRKTQLKADQERGRRVFSEVS